MPIRPQLLLLSEFTELEWAIKPRLEEWAEVVSFDAPGIGDEPLPEGAAKLDDLTRPALIERGLEKLDDAGWDRCFLVAEGWAIPNAVGIATARPDQVIGVALGHAKLSFAR